MKSIQVDSGGGVIPVACSTTRKEGRQHDYTPTPLRHTKKAYHGGAPLTPACARHFLHRGKTSLIVPGFDAAIIGRDTLDAFANAS
jgi:hypothetical protein